MKLQRRRQRERHKTIGFNEKNKDPECAFSVKFGTSSPYSAKQQREMTKIQGFEENVNT